MNNDLSDRQQAIKLRLAGQSVEEICRTLGRTEPWFYRFHRNNIYNVIKLAGRFVTHWEFLGFDPLDAGIGAVGTDGFNRFDHQLPEVMQQRQYVAT